MNNQVPQTDKSKGVTAILALIIPGAGHMYQEKIGAGFVWLIGTVIGYSLMIFPGLILHIISIISAVSINNSTTLKEDVSNPDFSGDKARDSLNTTQGKNLSTSNFLLQLEELSTLKSRGLIDKNEYITSKESLISNLSIDSNIDTKNKFLSSLIQFIDSGDLTEEEVFRLKMKF